MQAPVDSSLSLGALYLVRSALSAAHRQADLESLTTSADATGRMLTSWCQLSVLSPVLSMASDDETALCSGSFPPCGEAIVYDGGISKGLFASCLSPFRIVTSWAQLRASKPP